MNKTRVQAAIPVRLKNKVNAIFAEYGVTSTQVIIKLYEQVENTHMLPFDFSPNAETAKAIKEARKREGIVICKDTKDMFDKLGI